MTTCGVTHFYEAMPLENRDELSKRALQAGQETGNPTVARLSLVLPNTVSTKKRIAIAGERGRAQRRLRSRDLARFTFQFRAVDIIDDRIFETPSYFLERIA